MSPRISECKYIGSPGWYRYDSDFGSEIYHLCKKGSQLTLVDGDDLDIEPLGGKCCQCGAAIKWERDPVGVIYPIPIS